MEFRKYQHVERFGTNEVKDIELGECFIFPKVDGTNSSVWLDADGDLRAGSRKREISLVYDNNGFCAYAFSNKNIKDYLRKHPTHRLFGEFLTPHSVKTYKDDAWRKFYIFDVCIDKGEEELEYLPYDVYKPLLEEFNLDYIPPLIKIKNGSYDNFVRCLDQNVFLVKDGAGVGEGIVIKNYNFYNQYGRQTWAKIVTSEFKEKQTKAMGCPSVNNFYLLEEKIVDKYCTESFIEKEYQKILNEGNGWTSKMIPILLNNIWHEFIVEETWNFVKDLRNPTINFKTLNILVIRKVKSVKSEIFN